MVKIVKKFIQGALLLERTVPFIGTVLIAVIITAISVMRYAFKFAILGFEEFILIVALYTFFVGSAYATSERAQIRVTIIDSIPIRRHVREYIDLFLTLLASFICAVWAYYAFVYCRWTVTANIVVPPLNWPRVIIGLTVLIGVGLMSIHYLAQFVGDLRRARQHSSGQARRTLN